MSKRKEHSVLVVDDTDAGRYALSRMLQLAGFNVVEAATGARALELAEFVSAVVLDMHLPDYSGIEVSSLLRAHASTATLPIIHVSAVYVDTQTADVSSRAGADAYMRSPVDPGELTGTLDRLLSIA